MPFSFLLAVTLVHLVAYVEVFAIVALLLLVQKLLLISDVYLNERDEAERQRDEAKETLAVVRRMSELRVETVMRIQGFSR